MNYTKGRRQSVNKGNELEGIKEIKASIQEYLGTGDGSKSVKQFLNHVKDDDAFLLRFLKGRKNRPKHAWETVKHYAEIRYDTYPEIFPSTYPKEIASVFDENICGILKARDSKGRRIAFCNASAWDPAKYSLELLTMVAVIIVENIILDDDCMNNGIVFVQESANMGIKHVKEYSLSNMLRCVNTFWYAYPLKVKDVYYVNTPYFLTFLYEVIKPFFPKKLKERFLLSSSRKKFELLHERLSPDILPKFLGGNLEDDEAIDKAIIKYSTN